MKILILLLFLGMIMMPIFAQESSLDDVTNQLENQISQDNLKELESRVSELENQPSFDDQFVSGVEYTKLMERLYKLENSDNNINKNNVWSTLEQNTNIIAGFATAFALIFVGYETLKLRSDREQTLRAWIGQGESQVFVEGYFNKNHDYIQRTKWLKMTKDEKEIFDATQLRYYLEIKNYGQLPATNVIVSSKFVEKQPSRNDVGSSWSTPSMMMPGEIQKLFFNLTKEESLATEDSSKETYFTYVIRYNSPKNKKRVFGTISKFSNQMYSIVDSWDEKNYTYSNL